MRPPFTDESRLLSRARALTETGLGRLQLWHLGRYKSYQGISFDDRTPGDLLEEFYFTVATDADELAGRRADLQPGELDRLSVLEGILQQDRTSLRGLTNEQSERVYRTAHRTGDELADYWEYRIAKGLSADLDLEAVPPREVWDRLTDLDLDRLEVGNG